MTRHRCQFCNDTAFWRIECREPWTEPPETVRGYLACIPCGRDLARVEQIDTQAFVPLRQPRLASA